MSSSADYRWRILIEHCCEQCGCGFSSIKPNPRFCSHECYLDYSKEEMAERAKALWKDEDFRARIQTARRARGYPDKNRPEATAKRKLRTAAKNFIRRCLFPKNGCSSFDLLGYSCQDFRSHIELRFQEGMSWKNYGLWEIDHVFPISRFPANTPISVINSLENLQPLWKKDNRKKWSYV